MDTVILERVTKKYGMKTIFENYSLTVAENDFLCITGQSGKGKTTLLNIIGMLETPDSGKVILFGNENPKLNSNKGRKLLRHEIAFVFQNYGLVDDRTVKYNLEICSEYSSKKKGSYLSEALNAVGLNNDYLKMKIYELSGGEQQRVALARLFIRDCSLILADEPTGSLDPENRDKVISIFKELNSQGKTIIIVTHDNEVSKCAKRIIEL